jgi:hypothetical protein
VAAFLFDGQFDPGDYLKFILYAAAVGTGVSALVMFPLALLLERLAGRSKFIPLIVPLLPVSISMACLLGRFFLTGRFLDSLLAWPGCFLAFSIVFGFYWSVLWIGKALQKGFQRVKKSS